MSKYTTRLHNQKEHSLFKTVSVKTACPRKAPVDLHSWACWQGSLASCNYRVHEFSHKNTKKSCIQGEERQKRWPHCPLHIVRPLHWEVPGPPTLQRPSPSSVCTKIPEQPQHTSLSCFASIYHCQELFSRGFVCVPRRQGPLEKEWELQPQDNERKRSEKPRKD